MANKEKRKIINKKYRESHKKEIALSKKLWEKKNREHVNKKHRELNKTKKRKDYMKKYQREHREEIRRNQDKYHKTEKGILSQHQSRQNRRARVKGSKYKITKKDILYLFKLQKGKCSYFDYCGNIVNFFDTKSYHIEHKTPLSRGGKNTLKNLQITCPICNNGIDGKWYKTHEEFLEYLKEKYGR